MVGKKKRRIKRIGRKSNHVALTGKKMLNLEVEKIASKTNAIQR